MTDQTTDGAHVTRLVAAVDDAEDVLGAMWELFPQLRADVRQLLDEHADMRSRLDTIGLLLPVLAETVTEPHRDARSAELVVKAIAAHHAPMVRTAGGGD